MRVDRLSIIQPEGDQPVIRRDLMVDPENVGFTFDRPPVGSVEEDRQPVAQFGVPEETVQILIVRVGYSADVDLVGPRAQIFPGVDHPVRQGGYFPVGRVLQIGPFMGPVAVGGLGWRDPKILGRCRRLGRRQHG